MRGKVEKIRYVIYAGIIVYLFLTAVQMVLLSMVVTGKANQVSGQISLSVREACSMHLDQGWNLISICANASNTSVQNIVSNISYRYVMLWNESSQSFAIYSPRAAENPFNYFDTNWSYFILSDTGEWFEISGSSWGDINVSMVYGWDSPAWPYTFNASTGKYLGTIPDKYRFLMLWSVGSQAFVPWSPRSTDPAPNISLGEGQFILVSDGGGAVLVYNKTDLSS